MIFFVQLKKRGGEEKRKLLLIYDYFTDKTTPTAHSIFGTR